MLSDDVSVSLGSYGQNTTASTIVVPRSHVELMILQFYNIVQEEVEEEVISKTLLRDMESLRVASMMASYKLKIVGQLEWMMQSGNASCVNEKKFLDFKAKIDYP